MSTKQCLLSIISTAIALVLATLALRVVTTPTISLITSENAPQGQLDPLASVIQTLINCESSGNPDAVHYNDGAIGLHSRGILQFQRPTFSGYWKGLINKEVEESDIDNLWTDPEAQKMLATAMITDNPKNLNHWKVCTTRHQLLSKLWPNKLNNGLTKIRTEWTPCLQLANCNTCLRQWWRGYTIPDLNHGQYPSQSLSKLLVVRVIRQLLERYTKPTKSSPVSLARGLREIIKSSILIGDTSRTYPFAFITSCVVFKSSHRQLARPTALTLSYIVRYRHGGIDIGGFAVI